MHGSTETVRLLAEGDWPQLRTARLAALAEAPYAFGSTLAREQQFTEQTWRERAGRGRTLGAWNAGEIVGLATGLPARDIAGSEADPADWHLVGMWVSPEVRGQGIGDRLVAGVCELARNCGATSLTLWVTEVNGRAIAFYRRLGFAETGARQLVRPDEPDHWEAELRLRLD